MAGIYEIRRYGKAVLLITAAAMVALFLYISNGLVHDLSMQERDRMEIWADATKQIINIGASDEPGAVDLDFLLGIIERNTTIPVLLTDDDGNILQYRNLDLPEPVADNMAAEMSEANRKFLQDKLAELSSTPNVIHIVIAPQTMQHLYYEDSTLLKRLSYYPYVQLLVMLAFIAVVYFAVLSTKKAEQNKVWVGLSKETAHQLGTPISSLMAWMELLPEMGVDRDTVSELNKDVNRLGMIASRFSKIGSRPKMEICDLNETVGNAATYMSSRISPRITLGISLSGGRMDVSACAPLFEWVMENLIKNAVDAIGDNGSISVETHSEECLAVVEVSDSGKGIARKNFKTVFNPGFTTKSRGWGLGLTLAKRIVEQYHGGRIFVKDSTLGSGTTFRIELPLV
jgi:signal transduction histidine kinase